MLFDEIIQKSKLEQVNVFFDMDGTVVEYKNDTNNKRLEKGSKFYVNSRPIRYIINIAKKLGSTPNVFVHILSNCNLKEQIEQKINWLKKHMPFIDKNNIHIICYENITNFDKNEKAFLKAKYIKSNFEFAENFLIEDDIKNINATNKFFDKDVAFHISNLIK